MSENNTRYVDQVGKFRCQVKEPTAGFFIESGEKKTPGLRIDLVVIEEGDQKGKEISHYAWLSDAAFDGSISSLVKAFPQWDGNLVNVDNGTFTFAGSECEIVTESETYRDKPRIKVKWINAIGGGGGGAAMDSDKVKSLLKKLGGKSLAIGRAVHKEQGTKPVAPSAKPVEKPAAAPQSSEDPGAPADDDDIPY